VVRRDLRADLSNGKVAGQIIGYTGKKGRNLDGITDNHERFWRKRKAATDSNKHSTKCAPASRRIQITFDKDGRKNFEKLINRRCRKQHHHDVGFAIAATR